MAQTQTDLSGLKANAEVFFRSYGLSLSTGINALLKDAMQHGEMSLMVVENDGYSAEWEVADPYYNREMQARLRKAFDEIDAGKVVVHDLIETPHD